MDVHERRRDAVRRALELWPGSIHALAREAGISEALLRAIRDGDRTATPETVEAVARAAERWTERTAEAARILRDTLARGGDDG